MPAVGQGTASDDAIDDGAGRPSVLVVDDDPLLRRGIVRSLKRRFQVSGAFSIATALELMTTLSFDVILLDLMMQDARGPDGLMRVKQLDPSAQVIVITGHGSIPVAVECMKHGAFDFLTKPLDNELLARQVWLAVNNRQRMSSVTLKTLSAADGLVGASKALVSVIEQAPSVAMLHVPVLIWGEPSTGKSTLARMVHGLGKRASEPFVTVDCRLMARSDSASPVRTAKDLSTDRAGARLRTLAAAGTLYLRDVERLSTAAQRVLLNVLVDQERRRSRGAAPSDPEPRIVASCSADPSQEVAAGRLLVDLYFKLGVVTFRLPPLRERPEDVEPLANHFLRLLDVGRPKFIGIDHWALKRMQRYDWPGNARELRSAISHALAVGTGEHLRIPDLPESLRDRANLVERLTDESDDPAEDRAEMEHALIEARGDVAQAARTLGVSRATLYRRMAAAGLEADNFRRHYA